MEELHQKIIKQMKSENKGITKYWINWKCKCFFLQQIIEFSDIDWKEKKGKYIIENANVLNDVFKYKYLSKHIKFVYKKKQIQVIILKLIIVKYK